jgi:hypothetical protein
VTDVASVDCEPVTLFSETRTVMTQMLLFGYERDNLHGIEIYIIKAYILALNACIKFLITIQCILKLICHRNFSGIIGLTSGHSEKNLRPARSWHKSILDLAQTARGALLPVFREHFMKYEVLWSQFLLYVPFGNRDNTARNDDGMQIDLLFHTDDSSGGFAGNKP